MIVLPFVLALVIIVGCTPMNQPRIVGGRDATIEEAPYQVALKWKKIFWCGGSILGKKVVLTAAHCLDLGKPADYSVHVGSEFIPYTIRYEIAKYVKHEKYDTERNHHDIALVFLKKDLKFSDKVQPIALPDRGEDLKAGVMTTVTGYGDTNQALIGTPQLQLVKVPIVDHHVCLKLYGSELTANMICAGYVEGGKDSCQGDSGGPLTASGKVYGIVSWGPSACARPKYYGVYTKVSRYRDWIDEKIEQNL